MAKTGIIIRIKQIEKNCFSYGSKEACNTAYCFVCPNCDYQLKLDDGSIIHDFKYNNYNNKTMMIERYNIQFFDDVDFSKIDEYLQDDDSNYRLINTETLKTVRQSKEDRLECEYLSDLYYIIANGCEKFLEKEKRNDRKNYDERLKFMLGESNYQLLLKRKKLESTSEVKCHEHKLSKRIR